MKIVQTRILSVTARSISSTARSLITVWTPSNAKTIQLVCVKIIIICFNKCVSFAHQLLIQESSRLRAMDQMLLNVTLNLARNYMYLKIKVLELDFALLALMMPFVMEKTYWSAISVKNSMYINVPSVERLFVMELMKRPALNLMQKHVLLD